MNHKFGIKLTEEAVRIIAFDTDPDTGAHSVTDIRELSGVGGKISERVLREHLGAAVCDLLEHTMITHLVVERVNKSAERSPEQIIMDMVRLLGRGVALIEGDAAGLEWKRQCQDFVNDVRAEMSKTLPPTHSWHTKRHIA